MSADIQPVTVTVKTVMCSGLDLRTSINYSKAHNADIYCMWLGGVRVTDSGGVQVPYCPLR